MTLMNRWLVAVGLLVSASSFACGDYCDSGWAGVYETGGAGLYQSAYDVYQTTVDVDITTTTYMPVYDNSSNGGCGSLVATCGGGYDYPTLDPSISGITPGMPGDYNLLPRDPMNPYNPLNPNNPLNPTNPYIDPIAAGLPPIGPNMGLISRDPAVLPPTVMPQPLPYPIGMNPFTPQFPNTMIPRTPFYPPVYPPIDPVGPMTPMPVATNTLPNNTTVNRDPNTPYLPPSPPPFGGCGGVAGPCPSGPVDRPTGGSGGTPPLVSLIPGNQVPTVSNPPVANFTPSASAPGTPPQRNNVPRGARRTH